MNRVRTICLAFLVLPLCTVAGAQEMHKCKDAAGKITYSGKECSLIGLTSAGEITGRVSVQPAVRPSSQAGGALSDSPAGVVVRRPAARAAPQAGDDPAAQAAAKPPPPDPDADPSRRCFTVKTAKGTATRCNDTPPGAAGQAEGN